MEHALTRAERSWIARLVSTSSPGVVETETDYLLTIGSSQPAFLVLTAPTPACVEDPGRVMHLIGIARRQHRLVFQVGRAIVLAFNGAWNHAALVDNLAAILVRHQIGGPVPTLLPRSRLRSGLRALLAWLRELAAPKDDDGAPRDAPAAPAQAPAIAAPQPTAQEASSAPASGRASDPVGWAPEADTGTA